MRVAVLVHNDVVKDARVRKEVRTLVEAGYEVDVFGLTKSRATPRPANIEGCRSLELTDIGTQRLRLARNFLSIVHRIASPLAIAFVVCLLVFADRDLLLYLVAAALPATMLLFNTIGGLDSKASSPYENLFWLAPAAGAVVIGLLLRTLAEHGFIHWYAFASLMALTAGIWLSSLGIHDIRCFFERSFGSFAQQSTAAARELRYRQLASLLQSRVTMRTYDIVHCHDVIALIAGAAVKKRDPAIKLFWDAHEFYEELAQGNEFWGQFNRRTIQECSQFIDGFITISDSFAELYAQNYQLPKARVVMNATRLQDSIKNDDTLRNAARLGPTRKILLYQGGFAHRRGIEKLIEAAGHLPEPWSIVAMGWGPLEDHLRNLAQQLARGRAPETAPLIVIPPAPQDVLATWTAGATLGIIPYENTGRNHLYCMPNKLWEFPNAGVPILATDLVEMGRMIRTWDTGFLLPREFTAQDIVTFLNGLDDLELERKRQNCLRFSKEMSWSKFEPQLLGLYREHAPPSTVAPNAVDPPADIRNPVTEEHDERRMSARGGR